MHHNELKKDTKSLSTQLVDTILRRIHTERLGPGAHLGTELQLAEHHGISRTVVREAIGALRGLGVVSSRQGTGVFVAEADIRPILSKVFTHTAANEKGWRELAAFRVVVELGALLLAVQNASEEQIARLKSLAAEMRAMVEAAEGDPFGLRHAFLEKELEFHGTLFDSTGSEFASQLHETLVNYFRQSEKFLSLPDLRIVKEHEALAEAIAARDIAEAARVMSAHLLPIVEIINAHRPPA
ncbi:FadR/GntR family transcriptional regulator [Planctomicrobium sp. SH664]|uniref:FadR/GntR family transcriptional regulator n=1 Tax=Planctomicrobium sp. SH664 TaxID=3448125 RepID=UPI003F5CAE4E